MRLRCREDSSVSHSGLEATPAERFGLQIMAYMRVLRRVRDPSLLVTLLAPAASKIIETLHTADCFRLKRVWSFSPLNLTTIVAQAKAPLGCLEDFRTKPQNV